MQVLTKDELLFIFNAFDQNGNGMLDYKEFAIALCRSDAQSLSDSRSAMSSAHSSFASPKKNPNVLLDKFKERVLQRGPRGILGIQKLFKLIDTDGSQSISLAEFQKAISNLKLDDSFSQAEIHALFNAFDRNRDGTINYEEFLRTIRVR